MTQKATAWMRERLGELRSKVDTAERALQDYRDRERIVDAKGLAHVRRLAAAGGAHARASWRRAPSGRRPKPPTAWCSRSRPARSRRLRHDSGRASPPAVQRMKEARATPSGASTRPRKRYGPEHPNMIKARAELEGARENTRRQIEIVVAGISREYELARANEAAVERALAQSKADIQGLQPQGVPAGRAGARGAAEPQPLRHVRGAPEGNERRGDLQSTIARVVDPGYGAQHGLRAEQEADRRHFGGGGAGALCHAGPAAGPSQQHAQFHVGRGAAPWACRRWACCN